MKGRTLTDRKQVDPSLHITRVLRDGDEVVTVETVGHTSGSHRAEAGEEDEGDDK